jgi:hypothetical protein
MNAFPADLLRPRSNPPPANGWCVCDADHWHQIRSTWATQATACFMAQVEVRLDTARHWVVLRENEARGIL